MRTPVHGFQVLLSSWVVGNLGVVSQVVLDSPQTGVVERLGTAGLLVLASGIMLRYFMGELTKKDELIKTLMREHTEALVNELQTSHQIKKDLTQAMVELTVAVRRRKELVIAPPPRRRDG